MSGELHKLTMPKWGLSMKEGKIVEWLVEEGAAVEAGDALVEVESEKIANAVEAPAAGILRRRVAAVDEVLPVAGLLAVIADESVPDADVDALVADFQENFVPEEAEEDVASLEPETIAVGDHSIRYMKRGDGGAPAVLVHGFGGDLNNWLFNHEALAATGVVYALDLPGHGGSSKNVTDGTVSGLAQTLAGFTSALDLPKSHFVGHSMGGAVATAYALANPDKVLSLTLIASAGLGPEIDADYIEGFIASSRRKDLKPHLQKLFADPSLVNRQLVDDVLKYKRLDGVESALRVLGDGFCPSGRQGAVLRDRFPELSCPVLVIWGDQDSILGVSQSEGLDGNVRIEVLSGMGHMVQMEAATDVNRLVGEFWKSVST